MASNIIVLDCETGGLDCNKNPITQFAGILLDKDFKEVNRFQTFVKPYNNLVVEKDALNKTMVTMDQINKGVDIRDFVVMLGKFAKQGQIRGKFTQYPLILGHNVTFDIGFLTYAFWFCNDSLNKHFASNNGVIDYIDTMRIARMKWSKFKSDEDDKMKLGNCCKRMGIELADAHGAMNDVIATLKLFKAFSDNLSEGNAKSGTNVTESGELVEEAEKPRKKFRF